VQTVGTDLTSHINSVIDDQPDAQRRQYRKKHLGCLTKLRISGDFVTKLNDAAPPRAAASA